MMNAFISITSIGGLAVLAQINPITVGGKLAQMGVSGILGVVAVVSVCATVRLFTYMRKDYREHDQEMKDLIRTSIECMTNTGAAIRENTGVMVEVKDVIHKCKGPKS